MKAKKTNKGVKKDKLDSMKTIVPEIQVGSLIEVVGLKYRVVECDVGHTEYIKILADLEE